MIKTFRDLEVYQEAYQLMLIIHFTIYFLIFYCLATIDLTP